jgi:hypothetical protein
MLPKILRVNLQSMDPVPQLYQLAMEAVSLLAPYLVVDGISNPSFFGFRTGKTCIYLLHDFVE